MDKDQLKRKLRALKKMEKRIRFQHQNNPSDEKYIWRMYFSTKDFYDHNVKYPMNVLLSLNKKAFQEIMEEYFYQVYFQSHRENGLYFDEIKDLETLSAFGLSPGASVEQVKSKFRELAKKYHPDTGGSHEKMTQILDTYNKLLKKD